MPRKKSTKRTIKRQKASNIMVSVQKMEMDLIQTPSKIAAQLDKEINGHQKQEIKLNKAINKIKKQIIKAEAAIKSAGKAKSSAVGKKKLKVAKKMYNQAAEIHTSTNKQLQAVTNTVESLLEKQSKFIALGKSLNQFNSEWAKTLKKVKAKSKAQDVQKKSKAKKKSKSSNVEQLIQPDENSMVDSTIDEMTDLAS